MTTQALFSLEPPEAPIVQGVPGITERTMLDLLHKRFGQMSHNGASSAERYVRAEHVRATAGFFDRGDPSARTADFIAIDTWRSANLATHGVEVKVSRSDWLHELKQPSKAAPFLAWCTYWWLAVPDARMVRPGELPEGWGLMAIRGSRGLVACPAAPKRGAGPIPPESLASLLRAVAKTAASRTAPCPEGCQP